MEVTNQLSEEAVCADVMACSLAQLSDKHTQKLCKVSTQHIQLTRQMGEDIEKTCNVLKPVNKSLRQQTNQMGAKAVNLLKASNPMWQSVKQQAILSQKQISRCINPGQLDSPSSQKLILSGFASDLDRIFGQYEAAPSAHKTASHSLPKENATNLSQEEGASKASELIAAPQCPTKATPNIGKQNADKVRAEATMWSEARVDMNAGLMAGASVASVRVASSCKKVFEGELAQTVTQAVGKVLHEYVADPYQKMWKDYLEKSALEADLFEERVDTIIKAVEMDQM